MKENLNDLLKKFDFDYKDFINIQNLIIDNYTALCSSVEDPTCIILGAQPGAGKTEMGRIAHENLKGNAVFCNVDSLKNFHPFAYEIKTKHPELFSEITGPFAHQCNLALRSYCIENKFNFILETTFNVGSNINAILQNLKKHNYKSEIYLLSVPGELSKLSAAYRYEDSIKTSG